MIRYLVIVILCAGCATLSAHGLPPFPPTRTIVKPLFSPKAASLKSMPKLVSVKSVSLSSPQVVIGGAHCFAFFFNMYPIAEPPFPAYTNVVWEWDHLTAGQYYHFQTSRNLVNWLTREEGLWQGTMDDYFEIVLPLSSAIEFQRAFGGPPPAVAGGLVQPQSAVRMLKVHHRSELPPHHQTMTQPFYENGI